MADLERHTDRRRLLRRAGTLAAGVAGAGVAGAVVATPARAESTLAANTTVPIVPTRVVDTRNADLRWRIVNPSVLDSAGRLPKNQIMDVNLNDLASFPDAVFLNATVTGQTVAGYLSVFAYLHGPPRASSLNYSPNQNLTNLVLTATGANEGNEVHTGISVFTSQLTHVILDVVGFVISSGSVNPAVVPGALAAAGGGALTEAAKRRAEAIRKTKPVWE
ncbi:hypothetical protein ACTMTJ_14290 [Phytohabitans sp. LJ34]|uniref:hypothetical protein n=1 Tax=Phytohabitans sp. LJ34 TaxID=3452217 RepID=UPI003F8A045D